MAKIRALSSNFQKVAGEKSPSSGSSYAPAVLKKYRIPLLTKFTMVKLKIYFLSVSKSLIKSALPALEVICYLFRRTPDIHFNQSVTSFI